MYLFQSYPLLGEYIAMILKITKLTKAIICKEGRMGGDTYGSLKKR